MLCVDAEKEKEIGFFTDLPYKSYNLQYNTLDRWVDCLIDQTSDGPSIILID